MYRSNFVKGKFLKNVYNFLLFCLWNKSNSNLACKKLFQINLKKKQSKCYYIFEKIL